MTPKEKAEELINKFQSLNSIKLSDYSRIEFPTAKQCALIAVDEMINEASRMKSSYMGRKRYEYLLDVKQEIEKL